MSTIDLSQFMGEKLAQSKLHFERTIDCKHTEFDDLYPYMSEQPQFFWYKRYVAWQELLTIVKLASELGLDWKTSFTNQQIAYIEQKVLDAKILDYWYENDQNKEKELAQTDE